jgi:acyl-CoA thioesterase
MSFRFDEATAITSEGGGGTAAGTYAALVSDRYNIGPVPNGGYVMSLVQRALCARLPGHSPLTLTTHFLRPAMVGPARLEVEVVKEGRRYATARARMWQGEQEVVSSIATMGAAGVAAAGAAAAAPLRMVNGAPPELPPVEQAVAVPATDFFLIGHQFDLRLHPRSAGWMTGKPSGDAVMEGYLRFADGRDADLASLPLFCDAVTPAIFGVRAPKHVPTLEMTVHFRAAPRPGWLRFSFRTRFAFDGHLEEDGEVWDEAGQLVAQSRQLAVLA